MKYWRMVVDKKTLIAEMWRLRILTNFKRSTPFYASLPAVCVNIAKELPLLIRTCISFLSHSSVQLLLTTHD